MTHLNRVPSGNVNAYCGILIRHTITGPNETWCLKRQNTANDAEYRFVPFLYVRVECLVVVDLGNRRLDGKQWCPRQCHVVVTHGAGRERLAPQNKLRVQGICCECSSVRARLPNYGGKTLSSSGSEVVPCKLTKDPVHVGGLLYGRAPVLPLHPLLSVRRKRRFVNFLEGYAGTKLTASAPRCPELFGIGRNLPSTVW